MTESIQNHNPGPSLPRIGEELYNDIQIKTEIDDTSVWRRNALPAQHTVGSTESSSLNNPLHSTNMYGNSFIYQNFHNTNGYPQNLPMNIYNFHHQPFLPNLNVPPVSTSVTNNSTASDKSYKTNTSAATEKPMLKIPQFSYQENFLNHLSYQFDNTAATQKQDPRYALNQVKNIDTISQDSCPQNMMSGPSPLISSPALSESRSSTHTDHSEAPLKCSKCGMAFYCDKDLNIHTTNCYATDNNLQHQSRDESKSKYNCGECPYSCQSPAILKIHNRTHSGEKPFSCNFCEYKSGQKNNVTKHVLVHMKEKPFRCQYCEYRCAQKNNLVIHERTHTGEKPFACTFCEYKTVQKPNLVKHMYLHTNQKPYICEICNYRCVQKTNLLKHKQKHTMEKPFECNECNYRSSQKANLMKHQFSHGKEKPLQCDLCPYKCIQKCNLQKHKQTKHPKSPDTAEGDNLNALFTDKDFAAKAELSIENGFLTSVSNVSL